MKIILRKLFAPVLLALAVPASLLPAQVQAQSAAVCEQPVTVQAGDTLSTLATRYLGSALAYGRIVTASNAAAALDASFAPIQDPNVIAVGWKLCVSAAGGAPCARPGRGAGANPGTGTIAGDGAGRGRRRRQLAHLASPAAGRRAAPANHRLSAQPGLPRQPHHRRADPGARLNYNRYLVSYRSEGLKIYALMTVPQGEKPASGWPAIVFNHGYIPPEVYRPTERYVAYVDGFAQRLCRLSPRLPRSRRLRGRTDQRLWRARLHHRRAHTLASVRQHPDVDPQRLGMWAIRWAASSPCAPWSPPATSRQA